ncbi:hypothetical protein ACOME3_005152 [Neoechinorhynchus agilis]
MYYRQLKLLIRHKSTSGWMRGKHVKDPYVRRAQEDNYRARSAYKLIEMTAKKFFKIGAGMKVLEVGAAPGSWTQLMVNWTNSAKTESNSKIGLVLSIDVIDFEPVNGAHCIPKCNILTHGAQVAIEKIVRAECIDFFDLIVSDACPNVSGNADVDVSRLVDLQASVFDNYRKYLRHHSGTTIFKLFHGPESQDFVQFLQKHFKTRIEQVKPMACRKSSKEFYAVCKKYTF